MRLFIVCFSVVLVTQFAEAQWCTKYVPVHRTKWVARQSTKVVSYRNWIGWVKTKLVPYTYYNEEYYTTNEPRRECCRGYRQVGGSCLPICSACPSNGFCARPESCECFTGYQLEDFSCKPICDEGCPTYSNCTAPDVCTCIEGYSHNADLFECQPICSGACQANSHCTKPDVCECDEGYRLVQKNGYDYCQPHCENDCTLNAYCSAPNTCSCEVGYWMLNNACVPQCTPDCGAHSFCLLPNKCACHSGYELSSDGKDCQPICSVGCPAYSTCVDVELCACEQGYAMNGNRTQCVPVCESTCPEHSVCYRPGECLCDEGFRPKKLSGSSLECEPICPVNCLPYGKCTGAEGCECYEGYVLQTPPIDLQKPLCQPQCSNGCENGFCFAPEACVCNANYLMGPNNTCEPTCSLGCINGKCVEPEICKCDAGYALPIESVNDCQPICEQPCINGHCMAPNLCLCYPGYEPIESDNMTIPTHVCIPSCDSECKNGNCTAPNVCTCNEGYRLSDDISRECLPICYNCDFGECVEPDRCICWPGYAMTNEAGSEFCKPIETTTTVYDETSSTTELESFDYDEWTTTNIGVSPLIPATMCASRCKCWQYQNQDFVASLHNANCTHICLDDADEPCLNLKNCECNFLSLQLTCLLSAGDSYALEFGYLQNYSCLMPSFATTTSTSVTNKAPASQTYTKKRKSKFPWPIFLGSLVGGIVLVAVAVIIWRYYRIKSQSGRYATECNT